MDRLIPADVRAKIDETASFSDLLASPEQYVGRTLMLNGVALKTQRTKDATEIEVLQVPTDRGLSATDRKAQSQGRFLATQSKGFLDPAVIEKDTPLTVVGEVKGATTRPLDGGMYRYPILEIEHLVDWSDVRARDRSGGYGGYQGYYGSYGGFYSPWYYGYGGPFIGPYGIYPYYPYGPYYGLPYGQSVPAPAPPPPSSVPPQFQK